MYRKFKTCKKQVAEFLNKSLGIPSNEFLRPLIGAAGHISYVETVSNKADSLHRYIKRIYDEDIINAYFSVLTRLTSPIKNAVLAIDFTEEPFYSKSSSLWIHPWTGEDGVEGHFKYLVISVIKHEKIPIIALPCPVGGDKAELIDKLIFYARKICKSISVVLLDREFYAGAVIDKLQNLNMPYIIFVPRNEAVKRYINEGKDTVEHTIEYKAEKSTHRAKTQLVLINYENKDWCFATNIQLEKSIYYIITYKQRWQIETEFRIHDEARIKSKSKFHTIRFFYFIISLLLELLWRLIGIAVFKRFIIEMENAMFAEFLGIEYAYPS